MCVSGMTGQNLHFILSFICPGKAMLNVIISQIFFFFTSCPESIVLQSVTGGQCLPAFLVLDFKLAFRQGGHGSMDSLNLQPPQSLTGIVIIAKQVKPDQSLNQTLVQH